MTDRTDDWLSNVDVAYHERQFATPYRSTVAFCDWLERSRLLGPRSRVKILDLAAGQGANLYYMARRYPHCDFTGVDINPELVEQGNAVFREKGLENGRLAVGDLYALDRSYVAEFDGVVSFQTLSWLPGYREPLEAMCGLEPRWVALSSLFFDGAVEACIRVKDFTRAGEGKDAHESFYNVYPLPHVRELFRRNGFAEFRSTPFDIDSDLPKPERAAMGTYTERLPDGRRLQFSGPLFLPWHFIAAERSVG